MNKREAIECLKNGQVAPGGSELHGYMHQLAREAMQITCKNN